MGLQPATTREIRTFSFVVTGGELVAGEKVVRVLKGDRVELVWQSDQQVEVHLHGYDKLLPVRTGEPGRMTIDAQTTGRFPISIHTGQGHGHAPVAYFEVHPR